jgi:hypothetical protein
MSMQQTISFVLEHLSVTGKVQTSREPRFRHVFGASRQISDLRSQKRAFTALDTTLLVI